ncbi:MAG: SixA phosphatase family protein [Actinomycetales bacterium]
MATRTLLVVRHAKSDWDTDAPDHERPINARGRREAPKLGRLLDDAGLKPDLVVCSDATRAQQTWQLASAAWSDPPPVQVEPGLYDASRSEVLTVINETPDDVSVLACVGHEPTSSALVSVLAGEADEDAARVLAGGLKTACAAVLTFEGPWSGLEPGGARLVRVVSPR